MEATKNKLPKAFKTKWLKALRSGKYKQGANLLYDKQDNTYCCLGVACKVSGTKIGLNGKAIIDETSFGNNLNKLKVPEILKGSANDNLLVANLTCMNDDGETFNNIANYIEKYL